MSNVMSEYSVWSMKDNIWTFSTALVTLIGVKYVGSGYLQGKQMFLCHEDANVYFLV